jgi:hypothetical protein
VGTLLGLIVCSSFGNEALNLKDKIVEIATSNQETAFNKIGALEFLAVTNSVTNKKLHAQDITSSLYNANIISEALLYLNSMAMLKEKKEYKFQIDNTNLSSSINNDGKVKNRLNYLYSIPNDTVTNIIEVGNYDLLKVLSKRGLVCFLADYRTRNKHNITPFE